MWCNAMQRNATHMMHVVYVIQEGTVINVCNSYVYVMSFM